MFKKIAVLLFRRSKFRAQTGVSADNIRLREFICRFGMTSPDVYRYIVNDCVTVMSGDRLSKSNDTRKTHVRHNRIYIYMRTEIQRVRSRGVFIRS